MAVNFPSSPVEGQVHNVSPGNSFVWRGGVWAQAPLKTALPRNYLVNPSFQHAQETNGANVTGGYVCDQWALAPSIATNAVRAGDAYGNYHVHSYPTAKPSLAATDYCQHMQYLEGQRMADLGFGTANAKDVVLRFDAWAAPAIVGRYAVSIINPDGSRNIVKAVTLTAARQTFTVPFPGCPDGTWGGATNAQWGSVRFCTASGSTYSTATEGAWVVPHAFAVTGMDNGARAINQSICFADFGLYADPYKTGVAPPYERPEFGKELRRCQRYWYRGYGFYGWVWQNVATAYSGMRHPVPMRATPTGAVIGSPRVYDTTATPIVTAIQNTYCNDHFAEFHLTVTASGGLTAGAQGAVMYWQGPDHYIAMNARF